MKDEKSVKEKVLEEMKKELGFRIDVASSKDIEKAIRLTEKLTREECEKDFDENKEIESALLIAELATKNKIILPQRMTYIKTQIEANKEGLEDLISEIRKQECQKIQNLIQLLLDEDITIEKAGERLGIPVSEIVSNYPVVYSIVSRIEANNQKILSLIEKVFDEHIAEEIVKGDLFSDRMILLQVLKSELMQKIKG